VHDELRNAIQRAGMELPTPHPDLQQVQRGGKQTLVVRRSGAVVLVVALLVSFFALYPRFISDGKPSEVSVGPSGPENMPLQTDDVVSLNPNRLSVGDRAQLRVARSIGVWGLAWHLERQEGLSWEWIGGLVAGPGNQWKTRFYLGPGAANIGVDDVGFTQTASIAVRVPQLEPGKYRLGQEFFLEGSGSDESQNQWHYAEFEVVEGVEGEAQPCKWGSHIRPYLTSLLVEIGGPGGATLRNSMLMDTGTGLRLDAPQYEQDFLEVFVTADKFDLQNDNTQGMNDVGREQSFNLFRATKPGSDVLIASSKEVGWTISLAEYPRGYALPMEQEDAPIRWMRDAVNYMESHSLPPC
jgi:hypothetical protein